MDLTLRSARHAVAVTPNDTTKLAKPAIKGLYIGGTGTLSVLMADGTTAAFAAVPVGFFPISVQRVNSTGTTATNIVALS